MSGPAAACAPMPVWPFHADAAARAEYLFRLRRLRRDADDVHAALAGRLRADDGCHLPQCVPPPEEIVFRAELELLATRMPEPQARLHPGSGDDDRLALGRAHRPHRPHEAAASRARFPFPRNLLLRSGPVHESRERPSALEGFDMGHYHQESFGLAPTPISPLEGEMSAQPTERVPRKVSPSTSSPPANSSPANRATRC